MSLTAPTFAIELDLEKDGTWSQDAVVDVTGSTGGLRIRRGLGPDGHYQISKLAVTFDNQDGDWSPEYSSGPHYGKLGADVPIRVTCTHLSTPYTLWTGYVQKWRNRTRRGWNATTDLECADIFKYLRDGPPVNLSVSKVRDTDGAIQGILEAAGWTSANWNLDDGVQDLAYSFAIAESPLTAVMNFARAEMGAHVWATADNKVRFEARNSRLGLTADYTWGNGTSIEPERVDYELIDQDIISGARVRGTRFIDTGTGEEVFRWAIGEDSATDQTLQIAAGERYVRTFESTTPLLSIDTAVVKEHWLANDNADGSGTDRSSDQTVVFTLTGAGDIKVDITNGHSGAVHIRRLRVTGQATAMYSDRPEAFYELDHPAIPSKVIQSEVPWVDAEASGLLDYAVQLTHTYRAPWPRVIAEFAWDADAVATDMLSVEIGDLIDFDDTGGSLWTTGVDEFMYVDAIEHILIPGSEFRTVVTMVPAYLFRNLDRTRWDAFDRANATGDLGTPDDNGAAWADDSNMDINSNAARCSADTENTPNLDLGSGATDHVVFTRWTDLATTDLVGAFGRFQDSSNFYVAYLDNDNDQVLLRKKVAGSYTTLASPSVTVGAGPHELELLIQGSRLRVRVDQIWVADQTDTDLTTGTKVGPFFSAAQNSAKCSNFYAGGLN